MMSNNIVDLSQFSRVNGEGGAPEDGEHEGMSRLIVRYDPNNVPLVAAGQWNDGERGGFAVIKVHPDSCVQLSDYDVERIAKRVVDLFQSGRRKKTP